MHTSDITTARTTNVVGLYDNETSTIPGFFKNSGNQPTVSINRKRFSRIIGYTISFLLMIFPPYNIGLIDYVENIFLNLGLIEDKEITIDEPFEQAFSQPSNEVILSWGADI